MLTGPEGSSFGFSLTSLGDANIDEYGDFCVGAPHRKMANGQNSGAVYMFNGQKKWSKSATQIITADDIAQNADQSVSTQRKIRNFGISMKGNVDLDDDGHPDLIIGAKDLAVIVRARPIISITSQIDILGKTIDHYSTLRVV